IDGTSQLTGNVTATGDVAINGGDLTTTAGTFNLINGNATTVNFAGDATTLNIGDGAGRTTLNNNVTTNIVDNNADAFDIQENGNDYLNIDTTNSAEAITFGNTTTNPAYNFLGTGEGTFDGNLNVNGGTIATTETTGNLFNTNATTLNIGGAATTVVLGG